MLKPSGKNSCCLSEVCQIQGTVKRFSDNQIFLTSEGSNPSFGSSLAPGFPWHYRAELKVAFGPEVNFNKTEDIPYLDPRSCPPSHPLLSVAAVTLVLCWLICNHARGELHRAAVPDVELLTTGRCSLMNIILLINFHICHKVPGCKCRCKCSSVTAKWSI